MIRFGNFKLGGAPALLSLFVGIAYVDVAVYQVFQERIYVEPQTVEVLSNAINQAVVRMPGRRFPGIVVQGDRLASMTGAARDIADRTMVLGDAELSRLAGNLLSDLKELSIAYASACNREPTERDPQ